MTEIAPCPMPGCGEPCKLQENLNGKYWVACDKPRPRFGSCYETGLYASPDDAIASHNALVADVTLARNLRKVTRKGHVQCGPGKDRKTFAAACLARPNLLGVEIIRGRCAWNDTLDAALAELAKKIGGSDES